jgi:regulation of enolase protein 1 (concanavalin A-like superfamily)
LKIYQTGIELYNGVDRLSTIATDNWADWSVAPVSKPTEVQHGKRKVSILVQKEQDENGSSWWVYNIDGWERVPMREICWVAADQMAGGWQLEVSATVGRPSKDTSDFLEAHFEDFPGGWADD